jgi:pyruvate dehydrogenase E2 component (dihydrolipoamide acetyltransferase)
MDDGTSHKWKSRGERNITITCVRAGGAQAEQPQRLVTAVHRPDDAPAGGHAALPWTPSLFVPALRVVEIPPEQLRAGLNMRDNVETAPYHRRNMKDFTITLSNFGVFAGRYATPVIPLPTVAIVARWQTGA